MGDAARAISLAPLSRQLRASVWWAVLRNSGLVLAANTGGKFLVFSATALIARRLGPEGFGWYSLIVTFAGFVAVVPEFGMDAVLIREMARNPRATGTSLGAAIPLRSGLIAVAIVIGAAVFRLMGYPAALTPAMYVGMGLVVVSLGTLADTPFRSRMTMLVPALAKLSAKAGLVLLVVTGLPRVATPFQLVAAMVATVLPELLAAAVVFRSMWRRFAPRLAWGWPSWRVILWQSWPLALTAACIIVYSRIDVLMLSRMIGPGSVGDYAAAFVLAEVWGGVAMALGVSMLPVLSQFVGKSARGAFWRVYRQSLAGLMFLLIPVCAFFTLYAREALALVYGAEYARATGALRVLMWAQLLAAMGVLYTVALTADGRQRLILILASISAVVNVGVNLLLIPSLGIVGAALATVAAQVTWPIVLWLLRDTRAFVAPVFRVSLVPLLATLVFVGVAQLSRQPVIAATAICAVVYLASALVFYGALGPRLAVSER